MESGPSTTGACGSWLLRAPDGRMSLALPQLVFQIVEHLIAVAYREVALQAAQCYSDNIPMMELGADALGIA